jgi:L-aspartate semialdehyde sulfurtransferase ferredoxin
MAAKKKAPAKKSAKKKTQRSVTSGKQVSRYWLTYPKDQITEPLIWQVGQKFKVITNVRQASVAKDMGIVCVQVEGSREEIKKAVAWMERKGVTVEPVEIGAIAG